MDKISETKKAVRRKAWAEMYRAQQESGKSVRAWCAENGVSQKTFYYRLRKLREEVLEQSERHEIVPLAEKTVEVREQDKPVSAGTIKLRGSGISAELPANIPPELLMTIIRGLREC